MSLRINIATCMYIERFCVHLCNYVLQEVGWQEGSKSAETLQAGLVEVQSAKGMLVALFTLLHVRTLQTMPPANETRVPGLRAPGKNRTLSDHVPHLGPDTNIR